MSFITAAIKKRKFTSSSSSSSSSTSPDAKKKKASTPVDTILTTIRNAAPRQWYGTSVLGISQFSRVHLEDVFALADNMKDMVTAQGKCDLLRGKVLGNVFYEASTRTRVSFETAAYRLGANVVNVTTSGTSVKKGETLQDTLRCIECYTDVLVLRHPESGSVLVVDEYLSTPLLNAGDGTREHPTQAVR